MQDILYHALAIHLCSEELILERLQARVDESHRLVLALTLLKLALFIDTLLDKDTFERREEELFLQFALTKHEFLAQ